MTFESHLAPYFAEFIAYKKALGLKYEEQSRHLFKFDQFCHEHFPDETTISREMMIRWSLQKPTEKPGTVRSRVTPVTHLAAFMLKQGIEAYIHPIDTLPKEQKYTPHIFSVEELQRLFCEIDCCHYSPEVPNRHFIMPVLFRMIYCCGLRPGEALRLNVDDVDLQQGVLLIRETKFGNDRYVPMSIEMMELCRQYTRNVDLGHEVYFFPGPTGMQIPLMNINSNFRRFLHRAGISHGGRGKGPRIYDFRHTYAVRCLKRFAESSMDMNRYHQILKTYMGHSLFKYTAYYLRLTKEMFPEIRKKLEDQYGGMLPEIGGLENDEDD